MFFGFVNVHLAESKLNVLQDEVILDLREEHEIHNLRGVQKTFVSGIMNAALLV